MACSSSRGLRTGLEEWVSWFRMVLWWKKHLKLGRVRVVEGEEVGVVVEEGEGVAGKVGEVETSLLEKRLLKTCMKVIPHEDYDCKALGDQANEQEMPSDITQGLSIDTIWSSRSDYRKHLLSEQNSELSSIRLHAVQSLRSIPKEGVAAHS